MENICTHLLGADFKGKVNKIQIEDYKDPSSLHVNVPNHFESKWQETMNKAQELELSDAAVKPDELVEGGMVARTPPGYIVDDNGIYLIREEGRIALSYTPMWIERKLLNIFDKTEKIELGFKASGEVKRRSIPRSRIASVQQICTLSDFGLGVQSVNAKEIIKFLYEFEGVNQDKIDIVKCSDTLGWISTRTFLPTHKGGLRDHAPNRTGKNGRSDGEEGVVRGMEEGRRDCKEHRPPGNATILCRSVRGAAPKGAEGAYLFLSIFGESPRLESQR